MGLRSVSRSRSWRRDLTQKWCEATPRVSCVAPRGAFYAYPRIDIAESDEVFVKELIRQKHVMVVHGSGFGQKPGTKHFRIVFLPDEKTLTKAYAAIGEFIQKR
jgi:alanine-synthesizing transaminase